MNQRKQKDPTARKFFVAVDKDGNALTFQTADGLSVTYAAVGGPEMKVKLRKAVLEGQGVRAYTQSVPRRDLYRAALVMLPALGLDLFGLVGPAGLEVIPLTTAGIRWLKSNNFAAPDIDEPMDLTLYTAGRIATLEHNRPFSSTADISSAIPSDLFETV